MATALAQAKVPFEVHIFEQGMHGLSLADQSTSGFSLWINKDVEKWVGLAEAWLEETLCASAQASAGLDEGNGSKSIKF